MAGRGPAPKPPHLRQRRNRKAGAVTLTMPPSDGDGADLQEQVKRRPPPLPNPDGRKWHRLTRAWWRRVWESPMASEYLPTDVDGLGRLAVLIDEYYQRPSPKLLAEIRLQEARWGLSPVDRSRLQWEIERGEEAGRRRGRSQTPQPEQQPHHADPRGILGVVK